MKQRKFLLVCTLVAAFALPAFAQTENKTNSELTNAQVSKALGDIGRKWDTLPKDLAHRTEANEEMLRFLKQRPEVAHFAVKEDGSSVLIRLKDGTPIALIH